MGATRCRRASRWIPRCSPSSTWWRRPRTGGSRRISRPAIGSVTLHDVRFAGEAAEDKLARIRAEVAKLRADALVISDPHAVAWAFNIRGADVAHTPLPLAFAIVPQAGRPSLYVDGRKLSNDVRNRVETLADVREPSDFVGALGALGRQTQTVRLDQATAADALARLVTSHGGKVTRAPCPIALMKAVKNEVEIAGARAAHLRDGAAVTRFLAWFDREAPRGKLTEIDAVAALESFRRDTGLLKDISFPTIAGAGPDGAIVHYRVTSRSNRVVAPGELFLIVAGAEKPLNAFETLTLAPIDRQLIVPGLLTPEETAWLDRYHARVVEALSPLLDADSRAWLTAAARPL